ncbi:MAG: pilin [bacterium]|nr:pilin [bacterium]
MKAKRMLSLIIGLTVLIPAFQVYALETDTRIEGSPDSRIEENLDTRTERRETPTIQSLSLDDIDPLHGATIEGLLERIVGWLRLIAAPIAAGMIIYGAYQMLFAAGDPEKFKAGRQTILYTVIGYAIIWIAWGITSIIEKFLATP